MSGSGLIMATNCCNCCNLPGQTGRQASIVVSGSCNASCATANWYSPIAFGSITQEVGYCRFNWPLGYAGLFMYYNHTLHQWAVYAQNTSNAIFIGGGGNNSWISGASWIGLVTSGIECRCGGLLYGEFTLTGYQLGSSPDCTGCTMTVVLGDA